MARDSGYWPSDAGWVFTSGGLGAGLPGVKRLMDQFNINQTKMGED